MNLMVMPKYISAGIITSQHLVFRNKISKGQRVDIAIPLMYKETLEGKIKNKKGLIWYSNYDDLRKILKNYEWIYLRAPSTFLIVIFWKLMNFSRTKIYYDFRSLTYVEAPYLGKPWYIKLMLFFIEFFAYHFSTARSAVSQKLANKLKRVYGNREISVIPCCINEVKDLSIVMSSKNKKSEILQFVYVGSMSKWQCIDQIIDIYSTISLETSSNLTLITRDIKEAEKKVAQKDIQNVSIYSMSHDEVMKSLPSFDFGFLIREDKPINNLASPVKFLEYTSNGVIPVISNNVGDYSSKVEENDIGIVVDQTYEINIPKLKNLKNNQRVISKLLEFSRSYLFDRYLEGHHLKKDNSTS